MGKQNWDTRADGVDHYRAVNPVADQKRIEASRAPLVHVRLQYLDRRYCLLRKASQLLGTTNVAVDIDNRGGREGNGKHGEGLAKRSRVNGTKGACPLMSVVTVCSVELYTNGHNDTFHILHILTHIHSTQNAPHVDSIRCTHPHT